MTLDAAILKLIQDHEIVDQAHFMALLAKAGLRVTQPTLSRHLSKLGVQKIAGSYQRVDLAAAERTAFTVSVVPPNLIVIRTHPGYAQALAVKLDRKKIEGVAGTLAGDDTIFIAVSPPEALAAAVVAVEAILEARPG